MATVHVRGSVSTPTREPFLCKFFRDRYYRPYRVGLAIALVVVRLVACLSVFLAYKFNGAGTYIGLHMNLCNTDKS